MITRDLFQPCDSMKESHRSVSVVRKAVLRQLLAMQEDMHSFRNALKLNVVQSDGGARGTELI